MFSMIITIISIALVAALAVASIYYGGDALTKGSESANVSTLMNQHQQVHGAVQMYTVEKMSAPDDMAELTGAGYLSSVPTAPDSGEAWTVTAGVAEVVVGDALCDYLQGIPADVDEHSTLA
nr:hypothetical protein [uncultured Halomonas sp.]